MLKGRYRESFGEQSAKKRLTEFSGVWAYTPLLEEFKFYHPGFVVKAILVDALYGSGGFMNQAVTVFRTQTISQLSKHQKIRFRNQEMAVAQYFATYPGIEMTLRIRGWKDVSVVLGSARLYINAHQQKRLVMALKDEGEEEYRYRVASDLSGRAVDIAAAYTLRWLLEVFLEDWKLQEGWGRFAPPFGEERSSRGLTLSLLLNYPSSFTRNSEPAWRTLCRRAQSAACNSNLGWMRWWTAKHMNGRDVGRLEPTLLLKYRATACMGA